MPVIIIGVQRGIVKMRWYYMAPFRVYGGTWEKIGAVMDISINEAWEGLGTWMGFDFLSYYPPSVGFFKQSYLILFRNINSFQRSRKRPSICLHIQQRTAGPSCIGNLTGGQGSKGILGL